MTTLWKFRIVTFLICLGMGGVSAKNLLAEIFRSSSAAVAEISTSVPTQGQIDSARGAARLAPERSDLQAEAALALAAQALNGAAGYRPDLNEEAQVAAKKALAAGPHDSRIWLELARLQIQHSTRDPRIVETLKLSYFTGPSSEALVAKRLAAVTSGYSLNDPDLQELARGDVRLILTRYPNLKPALISAYRGAAPAGKQFIEQNVKNIDPTFVASLSKT